MKEDNRRERVWEEIKSIEERWEGGVA